MFEFFSFVTRNPLYAIKNWRAQYSVRKVMKEYKLLNPTCAWCGRKKKIQVHHKIPVSVDPLLAGDVLNFISLCQKDHLYVGHNGNFGGRYCKNIQELCAINKAIKVTK